MSRSFAQASLKQIKKIKLRSYKELAARTKRKEELSVLVQKLQTQRNLMVSNAIHFLRAMLTIRSIIVFLTSCRFPGFTCNQGKGTSRKVKGDEETGEPVQYKWKAERKR